MTAEDVRRCRRLLGLKQTDLAERLGVHVMTLSRWERGFVKVPSPVAMLLAMLLKEHKATRRGKRRP